MASLLQHIVIIEHCVQEIEVKQGDVVIIWLKMITYAHGFRGSNLLK